eukprot:TRINITY_DN5705_c0_g1_i1.p1 TRINITY_DN5705_c0_g1~~TRINITY_DN5705_c0_g1_i1.p1  ORF type:complete len:522 (-),score=64.74 TRINITY_DN5705_c0_g1_i1:7-1512(-)
MACQFVIRRWLKSLINDTKGQCRFYSKYPIDSTADVIVIGGGHNGLVASIILARQGLNVKVIEERKHVGGACITEQPFTKVPTLKASTGAYLLGLMPPELVKILGIKIPTVKRDPYYFLPTTGDKYLLFGSNQQAMEQQFLKWFHEDDWKAHKRMQSELASFREDLGVSWLMPPFSLEETAERFIRKHLRNKFIDLCTQPVMHYLDRFGFKNDLLKAMYAVTDGISGLSASINDSGTGMNFLTHNMCRLPDADGTWQLVRGGMGTLTDLLAIQAFQEGVQIHRGVKVLSIEEKGGLVESVVVSPDARTAEEIWHGVIPTKAVLVNADPFTLRDMVGSNILGDEIQNILGQQGQDGWMLLVRTMLAAVMLLALAASAGAAARVALVVGNAGYAHIAELANPKNDAELIAGTLEGLGFTLIGGGPQIDLDKSGFDRAVRDFGREAIGADVALFYFAGHGIQLRGSNFLVPVDANPPREADVAFEMVDSRIVLRQIKKKSVQEK